jgi:hypothetical protein
MGVNDNSQDAHLCWHRRRPTHGHKSVLNGLNECSSIFEATDREPISSQEAKQKSAAKNHKYFSKELGGASQKNSDPVVKTKLQGKYTKHKPRFLK